MKYKKELDIVECPEVYPPSEDTFLLLDCLEVQPGEEVLEMGCGTGLVACHLAAAGARVTAADINPHAVECTRRNLERNSLPGKVVETDMFDHLLGKYLAIVFNPPYVASEDEGLLAKAWAGGPAGTEVLARFLKAAPGHLLPGGRMVVVLSTEMRPAALEAALEGFHRRRLGSRSLYLEELWIEELVP